MQGSLEGRLRALPGVLDCSLNDAGVALLVHPEVDVRLLQARAQAVFAELGDPRPLMIMGGMPPSPARRAAGLIRVDATPLSLTVFAVLVLCLLALVPLAPGRDSGQAPPAAAPLGQFQIASSLTPELFRPAAAVARSRARAQALSAVSAPPAPAPEPAAMAKADEAKGRRPAPGSRKPAPALAPAVRVVAPVCEAGRSAAHRAFPKAPLPPQSNSPLCD